MKNSSFLVVLSLLLSCVIVFSVNEKKVDTKPKVSTTVIDTNQIDWTDTADFTHM